MVHLSTSLCGACLLGTISLPVWLASPYSSAVGADFGPLEKRLKNEQWEAAAEETQDLVFQISKKNAHPTIGQDMLTAQAVESFPCKDIKSLDALWRKYSQDRFGYRSQLLEVKRQAFDLNYERLRETPDVWEKFAKQVGWQAWQERTDDALAVKVKTDVPEGTFPLPVRSTADFGDRAVVRNAGVVFGMSFLARSQQCGVE